MKNLTTTNFILIKLFLILLALSTFFILFSLKDGWNLVGESFDWVYYPSLSSMALIIFLMLVVRLVFFNSEDTSIDLIFLLEFLLISIIFILLIITHAPFSFWIIILIICLLIILFFLIKLQQILIKEMKKFGNKVNKKLIWISPLIESIIILGTLYLIIF
jgi:hypothetical protein